VAGKVDHATSKTLITQRRQPMRPKEMDNDFVKRAEAFRKMLSKPKVTKAGDFTVGVTKTGCIQVRRKGEVIIALTRHAGKVVLPPSDIKELAPHATAPGDNKHMSWVPWNEMSEDLIIRRLRDKRSNAQVMEDVYGKGKMSSSQERYRELKTEATKETEKTKKAKGTQKRTTKAKTKKKGAPKALKAKAAQA